MTLTSNQRLSLMEQINPLINDVGLELVDLELKNIQDRQVLQITLDKESGVTLAECAKFSKKLSYILDVEEPFPFEYSLEVSSPGVYRELKTDNELARFQGKRIKVRVSDPEEGRRNIIGALVSHDDQQVIVKDEKTSEDISLNRAKIQKLSLNPDL